MSNIDRRIISILEDHCIKNQFQLYETYKQFGSELTWSFLKIPYKVVDKIHAISGHSLSVYDMFKFNGTQVKIETPLINIIIGETTRSKNIHNGEITSTDNSTTIKVIFQEK